MTTMFRLLFSSTALLLLPCHAWIITSPLSTTTRITTTRLYDAHHEEDFFVPKSSKEASFTMSPNDLMRLSQLRNRQTTLPLLICQDSLLPGQTMELSSPEDKFQTMCSSLGEGDELALVGMHPFQTGNPLTVGVICVVVDSSKTNTLKVKGKQVVDVQGEPWWDSKKSCFMTDLEKASDVVMLTETATQIRQQVQWFDELPNLVSQWCTVMEQQQQLPTDMENSFAERAYQVASLLNPSIPYDTPVSLEIRPALLACRNDYDRLHLVHTALQASLHDLRNM